MRQMTRYPAGLSWLLLAHPPQGNNRWATSQRGYKFSEPRCKASVCPKNYIFGVLAWDLVAEMGEFLESSWFSPPVWLPGPGHTPFLLVYHESILDGPLASIPAPIGLSQQPLCSHILDVVRRGWSWLRTELGERNTKQ